MRIIWALAMLVICGAMLALSAPDVTHAQAPTSTPILADESAIVKTFREAPATPARWLFIDSLGAILSFDDATRKAMLDFGNQTEFTIDYPEGFTAPTEEFVQYFTQRTNARGTFVTICNNGLFLIHVEQRTFTRLDKDFCGPFSPDGRYIAIGSTISTAQAGEFRFYDVLTSQFLTLSQIAAQTPAWMDSWSRNWSYYSAFQFEGGDMDGYVCEKRDNGDPVFPVYVRRTDTVSWLPCPWIGFRPGYMNITWIDDSRAILTYLFQPASHYYDLYLIDAAAARVTYLGNVNSYALLSQKLITSPLRSVGNSASRQCPIVLIDLQTRVETPVDTTFCAQPSDFTASASQVFYLRGDVPSDSDGDYTRPILRTYTLATGKVETLPLPAINMIGPLSPSGHYLPLLADRPLARRNIFDLRGWLFPKLQILDVSTNQLIYTTPLFDDLAYLDNRVWSPTGNAIALGRKVVQLSPTNLDMTFPVSYGRFGDWSADGQEVIFHPDTGSVIEYEAFVIRLADHSAVPVILKSVESTELSWCCAPNHWLFVSVPTKSGLKGWILDPDRLGNRRILPVQTANP